MAYGKHKYPWIPNKYYKAVMFACKILRDDHYYNKAISTAADYYNVDAVELEKHVQARINAGKRSNSKKGITYKWFVVERAICSEGSGIGKPSFYTFKAKSADTLKRRLYDEDAEFSKDNDTGSVYSLYRMSDIIGTPYESEQSANDERDRLNSMKYIDFDYEGKGC